VLNSRLLAAIAQAVGTASSGALQILQCSSPSATGAIIFHVWMRGEHLPRLVIKTPRDPRSRNSVALEWQTVALLRSHSSLCKLIPEARANFSVDGADFFAYEGVAGRTMFSRYRNRVLMSRSRMFERFAAQALQVATTLHSSDTEMASAGTIADDFVRDLEWLQRSVPSLQSPVVHQARLAAAEISTASGSLPAGRVHGDFSPYNLISTTTGPNSKTSLIDWEHAEAKRPQHLDILRFISGCHLMGWRGGNPANALFKMSDPDEPLMDALFRPWLAIMGSTEAANWMQPRLRMALWWQFWIHAARREQERLADPADVRDSIFVRGLLGIANQD
jgi:Phosphotransferase enzyme family